MIMIWIRLMWIWIVFRVTWFSPILVWKMTSQTFLPSLKSRKRFRFQKLFLLPLTLYRPPAELLLHFVDLINSQIIYKFS